MAVAAALLATVGIASPASAATLPSGEGDYCVFNVDTGAYGCYATELDAELATEPGTATRSLSTATTTTTATTTATTYYTYVRAYENSNYGGATLTFSGTSYSSCTGNGIIVQGDLPSSWNDRISSFKSYLGCRFRVYEHIDLGGAYYGPYISASSMGSFNDRASSFQIRD